jgi:hypothetical protein
MQASAYTEDSRAADQRAFVERVTELAAGRLDDESIAHLVQRLVEVMVRRADQAPNSQESARRHGRIQSLIKRL